MYSLKHSYIMRCTYGSTCPCIRDTCNVCMHVRTNAMTHMHMIPIHIFMLHTYTYLHMCHKQITSLLQQNSECGGSLDACTRMFESTYSYVRMYVCIIRTFSCENAHIRVNAYVRKYVEDSRVRVTKPVCTCTDTLHIYTYVYVHVCIYTHINFIRTRSLYMFSHQNTYMYVYTQVYTRMYQVQCEPRTHEA